LAEIRIYPVKSLRGAVHATAHVQHIGLATDRRWMVTTEAGVALTQRELHHMALIQAEATPTGVTLTAHGHRPLAVPFPPPNTRMHHVKLWRESIPAHDAGPAAAAWLSQALGTNCTLVHLASPTARPADPAYARPGEMVSFADGFPILLTTRESLADLNTRLPSPVEMLRFRPNIVLEGAEAWAEDTWRRIRIGGTVLRVVKPCDRCIMTTIDPATAERPDPEEPLRTLKTFRRDARGRVLFGQNVIPETGGDIRAGDAVEIETMHERE
jgi:uncharacterized protein YcbX